MLDQKYYYKIPIDNYFLRNKEIIYDDIDS